MISASENGWIFWYFKTIFMIFQWRYIVLTLKNTCLIIWVFLFNIHHSSPIHVILRSAVVLSARGCLAVLYLLLWMELQCMMRCDRARHLPDATRWGAAHWNMLNLSCWQSNTGKICRVFHSRLTVGDQRIIVLVWVLESATFQNCNILVSVIPCFGNTMTCSSVTGFSMTWLTSARWNQMESSRCSEN